MSELAVDEDERIEEYQPPPPVTRPSAVQDSDDDPFGPGSSLTPIETRQTAIVRPVIAGAIVVYLGASESTAFPMPGRVLVERIEMEPGRFVTRRSLTDAGNQQYVFERRDQLGRLTPSRLIPATKQFDANLHGRPWARCEHPEHLRQFRYRVTERGSHEFLVMVPPPLVPDFEEYVRRVDSLLARKRQAIDENFIQG